MASAPWSIRPPGWGIGARLEDILDEPAHLPCTPDATGRCTRPTHLHLNDVAFEAVDARIEDDMVVIAHPAMPDIPAESR